MKGDFQNLQRELDSINKTIEENQLKGLNIKELECHCDSIQAKLARHYKISANGYIRSCVKIMREYIQGTIEVQNKSVKLAMSLDI